MKVFFGIGHGLAPDAFRLNIDYDLGQVGTTRELFEKEPTPPGFLGKFQFSTGKSGKFGDLITNSLGWYVFSPRICELLETSLNCKDIELHQLPGLSEELNVALRDYRVLGVKRHIPCVDMEESDIRWGKSGNRRYISAFRNCILRESAIPDDVDIFLRLEYPMMPIISGDLAVQISELHPSGMVFERMEAK